MTCSMVTFPTAQPTKRIAPTGGWHNPMPRLSIMIMPKCTGSTPKLIITGKRIGVQIRIDGAISTKVPRISSKILIKNRMTYLLLEMVKKNAVICAGLDRSEHTAENSAEDNDERDQAPSGIDGDLDGVTHRNRAALRVAVAIGDHEAEHHDGKPEQQPRYHARHEQADDRNRAAGRQ